MEKTDFKDSLFSALDAKSQWYDTKELPSLLENYRLLHTCTRTLFDFLVKKALITPDPYKGDKRISSIVAPDNNPFPEQDRSMVMGTRFSDYESMLDFLCNYYKFSVSNITLANIKKLTELNNAVQWNSFSMNSNNINTRMLASMLLSTKQNADALTASMVSDSLTKASKALNSINKTLKGFTDFQKEMYKGNIRRNVFTCPQFNADKAESSPSEELAQIKKNFAAVMGKEHFYNNLVDEIIHEDHDPDRDNLRKRLLARLAVNANENEKKKARVDTKDLLMMSIRVLGAMPGQIMSAKQKIVDNHDVLESEHNSLFDKLKKALRKAFNIAEKPLYYSITITDGSSDTKRHERLDYNRFIIELENRAKLYSAISVKKSAGYERIMALTEPKILEYVNKQISESQTMLKTLNGLDDFFKNTALPQNKSKIKGLKMEITTLKNSVIKANQSRSEYTAFIEEEAQLKKLGIANV